MAQSKRDREEDPQPRDVLAYPLRVLILSACGLGETSTTAFARRCGERPANVRYHFGALLRAGYLRIAREERVRGFMRRYYVAKRKAVLMDDEFAGMTIRERHRVSWAVVWDLLERCKGALDAGTMDARPDSRFDWRRVLLDEAGWRDLMGELKRLFEGGYEIQAEAMARLKVSGEEGIPTTYVLAGFESPAEPGAADAEGSLRRGASSAVVRGLLEQCRAALRAGTMDARTDSHLSWNSFRLDLQGWNDLMGVLRRSLQRAAEIEDECRSRLKLGGEEPIHTTFVLGGFESPAVGKPKEEPTSGAPPRP